MKKSYIFIILIVIILLILGFMVLRNSNKNLNVNSISATRLNANSSTNTTNEYNTNNETNITNEIYVARHDVEEIQMASFSTKLSGKDSPRSRNIGITTLKLNGTTINDGETFSFCETIGNPTAELGYEEADSFDEHGNTVKTYGGGNCQVSSTLYNVILQISELEVKERHAHVKPVHYVEKDKDATVAYGSVDFKFKNNSGSAIKIYAYSDLNSVNIRIVKLNS